MKAWTSILIAIVVLILLIGGYQLFRPTPVVDYAPKRPANLPKEAVWAGGMDGGSWFVINPQQPAPDVWQIKIYNDNGSRWAKGNFWWKGATNTKLPLPLESFDGRIIYLEGNKKMLPVGEHFYPVDMEGQNTKVITYPDPSPDYTELKELGEREVKPESW